ESRRPIIGNIQAGLSGPAIRPMALLKVHQVYEAARGHGVPIIGQGGIETARDAVEFMLTGATAVGLGTALFYEPMAAKAINLGLEAYLERHGLASVAALIGGLDLARTLDVPASG
ncbi:MAG TPA: dihydroorotate dehydrogenase, partial [Gammaproteobacteria bacterium]|nr:dihydroorotate dehydrogenase [Gammaproteobacteria bacterium]